MKIIKKLLPKKKKTEIEVKKNFLESILDLIENLTSGQLAFISAGIFMIGVLMQLWLISKFIWWFEWIYYINIASSIVFFLLLFFILIISILFPLIISISVPAAILQVIFWIQIPMIFASVALVILIILSIWLLFVRAFKKFILDHYLPIIVVNWILFLVGYFIIVDFISNQYSSVEVNTKEENIEWRLYFSNLEYFFVEDNVGTRMVIPRTAIESIKYNKEEPLNLPLR